MGVKLLEPKEIVRLLDAGPDRIEEAVVNWPNEALARRPTPDEWSPNEILAHLRACQDVWGGIRVVRMLEEDHPTIRAVNPNTWLAQTDYRTLPFLQSLATFTEQRKQFVARIAHITAEQWVRTGNFTGGGKPRQYSVHTEADALARHERSHLKQIERLCLGR